MEDYTNFKLTPPPKLDPKRAEPEVRTELHTSERYELERRYLAIRDKILVSLNTELLAAFKEAGQDLETRQKSFDVVTKELESAMKKAVREVGKDNKKTKLFK